MSAVALWKWTQYQSRSASEASFRLALLAKPRGPLSVDSVELPALAA